jgi:DNA polymerase III epsilon subunit-like protein
MDRIVAFDVETPNSRNNRICAIGLTVIEDGAITDSQYYLVNPECEFDYQCIQIHGIRPGDVKDAPVFPIVWNKIREIFRSCLVAAHNASFDLCVLKKTLQAYGMNESLVYFVDTLAMARAMVTDTRDHKLSTLCARFHIPLDHHHAGSDSNACASLLCNFSKGGADLNMFTKSYHLGASAAAPRYAPRLSVNSQALLTLNGILSGVTCDNVLVDAEVDYLQKWLDENADLKGNYPYDKIYATVSNALADGILMKSELDDMLDLFQKVTNPVDENACGCEKLDVAGKNICLTGEFDYGSKAEVNEQLISRGAVIQETVTLRTEILLVGGQGSSAWSAGNYGNKVKKALEMQGKGVNILLIREADFFASLAG